MSFTSEFLPKIGEREPPAPGGVQVRSMTAVALTSQQRTQLSHAFELHKLNARASLGTYLVKNGKLADGTPYRIVSIGPQHAIYAWPSVGGIGGRVKYGRQFMAVPALLGGLDGDAAPKWSKMWHYKGATDAPQKLRPNRKLVDASGIGQHPGNLTWWSEAIKVNKLPMVVSWYGKATRYGRADYFATGRQLASYIKQDELFGPQYDAADARGNWADAYKAAVWTNGVKHGTYRMSGEDRLPLRIVSAALKKTDTGLWLWAVSFIGTQLSVWKGKIDPYRAGNNVLEQQFEIDYRIDTTPKASTQWWEALLQPLYFNASCTACAGLVVARSDSPTNSAAATVAATVATFGRPYVVLDVHVDIETQTTTFTNRITKTTTTAGSSSGDFTSGASSYTHTDKVQHYGAVDWVGDTRKIAIIENVTQFAIEDAGENEVSVMGSLISFSHDASNTITTSYRVFVHPDGGEELASRSFTTVALTTFHVSRAAGESGGGWQTMSLTDPIFIGARLEGGDLRHGCVTVSELREVGSSQVDFTFEGALGPLASDADTLTYTFSTQTAGRRPERRLAIYKDGTLIDTGASRDIYSDPIEAHITFPVFIWQANHLLNGTNLFYATGAAMQYQPPGIGGPLFSDATVDAADFVEGFDDFLLTRSSYDSGMATGGSPLVNAQAFAVDSSQWFYCLGPYNLSTELPDDIPAPVSAFVIDGTLARPDPINYFSAGLGSSKGSLVSPIYLDNVPEPT